MIAMTFDDGPYSPVTEKILDVFEQNNGKATFFCVGSRVAEYASSVQRAYNMGCEIASHTYSHVYLTRLKAKGIKKNRIRPTKLFGISLAASRLLYVHRVDLSMQKSVRI